MSDKLIVTFTWCRRTQLIHIFITIWLTTVIHFIWGCHVSPPPLLFVYILFLLEFYDVFVLIIPWMFYILLKHYMSYWFCLARLRQDGSLIYKWIKSLGSISKPSLRNGGRSKKNIYNVNTQLPPGFSVLTAVACGF